MSVCRSCGAPIVWPRGPGARTPLDANPSENGTIRLDAHGVATVVASHRYPGDGLGRLYVSHFATCPHARDWRRGPRRPA